MDLVVVGHRAGGVFHDAQCFLGLLVILLDASQLLLRLAEICVFLYRRKDAVDVLYDVTCGFIVCLKRVGHSG